MIYNATGCGEQLNLCPCQVKSALQYFNIVCYYFWPTLLSSFLSFLFGYHIWLPFNLAINTRLAILISFFSFLIQYTFMVSAVGSTLNLFLYNPEGLAKISHQVAQGKSNALQGQK